MTKRNFDPTPWLDPVTKGDEREVRWATVDRIGHAFYVWSPRPEFTTDDPTPWVIPNTYDAMTGAGDLRFSYPPEGAVWSPREQVRTGSLPTGGGR